MAAAGRLTPRRLDRTRASHDSSDHTSPWRANTIASRHSVSSTSLCMTLPCAVYIALSSVAAASAIGSITRASRPAAASAAATIPTTRQPPITERDGI